MFCDGCGATLQGTEGFCSRCGREVRQGMQISHPRSNRVQEHVRLLGILWMAISAIDVVGGVALFILSNTLFAPGHGTPPFLHPLMRFLSVFVVAKAVAQFATGYGLLQREPWARTFALVLGFVIMFFNIPFGTALGAYTLWVLLPASSEQEYDEQVRSLEMKRA